MADDTPEGKQSRQDDPTSTDQAKDAVYAKAEPGQTRRLDPNGEEAGGSTSWRAAMRRAREVLMPRASRRPRWSLLVPLIAALAGLLFTTTARTAAGTNLRDDRRPEISRLISERKVQVEDEANRAAALRAEIDNSTRTQAGSDDRVAAQQQRADGAKQAAGFAAVHGPGLRIVLEDAPRRADGKLPTGARPDDVVVHQQDVQSVVNALWAGGAEAMVIMDIRVVSTSAVRCVGNTLLLHDRVFSPPFEIKAIGDPSRLRAALDADPGVRAFRDAATLYGLGYTMQQQSDILAPAHIGSGTLEYARAAS
ncbi:MAG: hypothetical protein QOE61_4955 [Micromonosporaceae bacterium]|nr:hypothetical protein [Micromonosporaceae bacterium]